MARAFIGLRHFHFDFRFDDQTGGHRGGQRSLKPTDDYALPSTERYVS